MLESERIRTLTSRWGPPLLLVVAFWVVRYWHSGEFGLYEDDLTHLPAAAAMSGGELSTFLFDSERYLRLYGQGHPLHYTFIYLLTNLGWRIGDLTGPYWFGFLIEALNIILFYTLLRRCHSPALAGVGGLMYVLYSADTTQAYLTYSLGLQPSLTFLLLACHTYLSGRRWLSYPLAALTLLTYETSYAVFFAMPWLITGTRRPSPRSRLAHVAILGLILIGMVGWRLAAEDDRVAGLTSMQSLVAVPIVHMLQGPVVSLGTYLYRPFQAVLALQADVAIAALVALGGWLAAATAMDVGRPTGFDTGLGQAAVELRSRGPVRARIRAAWHSLPERARELLQIALVGSAMLVLAYPLTFTVRAYAISGRDTRVHASGVVGAAILLGAAVLLLLWIVEGVRRKTVVVAILGMWIGLLAGYGFVVQRDYRLAWEYQKSFWSELVPLLPDVAQGTSILVDPSGLRDTRQIGANYWNLPVVLEQLYEFPAAWRRPPWVYRLAEDWRAQILADDGTLALNAATTFSPPSNYDNVDPSNTILIETNSDGLRRVGGRIRLDAHEVRLKPVPEAWGEPAYPHGFLYPYLIEHEAAATTDEP